MIPLKLETLLEGKVVEANRVEYKEGWNPQEVVQALCAFANDYENVNGGYLVVGIKAKDGIPELPPVGIPKNKVDDVQKELFEYCNKIEPRYIPNFEIVNYPDKDTYLLYMKCSAGDAGPYRAPETVYFSEEDQDKKSKKKPNVYKYWIRVGSVTTSAKQAEISELFEKFNAVPFDDRVNRTADVSIIRRGYLEDFLRESDSELAGELNKRSIEDLLISLEVANETDTGIELRNIALLMFSEHPEKYIPGTQINMVHFKTADAESGDDFEEKAFTGPIWKQIRDVLSYIETNVIVSKTVKIDGQAESVSFYNFPYNALEEAIVNAVFHKTYRDGEPVEVRIYVDSIVILNYPGPPAYISMEKFVAGKARARKYRNRRIGEFFKEIDLSEKQATGISKILRVLKNNGSPKPEFETDNDRTYLETTIRIHDGFEMSDKNSVDSADYGSSAIDMAELMAESMTELERNRMNSVNEYLDSEKEINSSTAAELLSVEVRTARRLLNKAVKAGLLIAEGKTNDRVYKRK